MAAAAAPGEECILLLLLFLLFLRKVIALSRNSHGGWRISSLSLVLLRHPYFLSPCGFFFRFFLLLTWNYEESHFFLCFFTLNSE